MKEPQEPEEKSLSREIRDLIMERGARFLDWMKPVSTDPFWLQIIKLILKVPVFLLVLLLSPIAFIVLVFTFFAAV